MQPKKMLKYDFGYMNHKEKNNITYNLKKTCPFRKEVGTYNEFFSVPSASTITKK